MKSSVTLKEGMHFIGELNDFDIPIDADEQFGGMNKGPKPKGLLLTGLAGCTGMDVISVLRKMRAEPDFLKVDVEAQTTDDHPIIFKNIIVTYTLKGKDLTEEKAKKAIKMSLDKYCGVAAMLKKVCPLDYKLKLN